MAGQMAALRNLTQYRLGFRVAVAAATIGMIYGYDLGNISGALLFITAEADMRALEGDLRERGADVAVVADEDGAALPLPAGVPEALAPIVAVVRAQQLALALARRRGLDPDAPEGLSKVTVT